MGNFNSGAGNDSMVISGKHLHWNEWTDDLSYVGLAADYSWTYLGSSCGEPAIGPNQIKHPMDR